MVKSISSFTLIWAESVWNMLADSALYFLAGVILAGMIWLVLNETTIRKLTGGSPASGVLKAALLGLPLPLCSCSVLPVAIQLRRAGLSKGGTMAFLVSTPESGVDSVLLTYALTDPLLTVARPVAAYISAIAVGLAEALGFEKGTPVSPEVEVVSPQPACSDTCGGHAEQPQPAKSSLGRKILLGVKYAFTDLVADLAPYLLIGFLLAGLIDAAFQVSGVVLPATVTSGWIAYAWAIAIGLPLYVCASSSTPLAAVLLGAGFSPGAILVFLLVGPATNLAGIVVLRKILGGWSLVRYLAIIVVAAVGCGIVTDQTYGWLGLSATYGHVSAEHGELAIASILAAFFLSALILYYSAKKAYRRLAVRFA